MRVKSTGDLTFLHKKSLLTSINLYKKRGGKKTLVSLAQGDS
jgi:hypothetical protein